MSMAMSQKTIEAEERKRLEQKLEAMQAEIDRLNERLVETQMRAHKWMEAHDKLQAGKPYEFPKPADVPDAIAEIDRLRENVTELWHESEAGRKELHEYLGMTWEQYQEWVTPRASLGQGEASSGSQSRT